MQTRLAALLEAEQTLVHYDQPPDRVSGQLSTGNVITLFPGSQPVLISAPHSSQHWRAPAWKQEEEYTAALGYTLHRATGAHFIYCSRPVNPDPHDDADSSLYKQMITDLARRTPLRMVIDLHGARGDRDFAVALGTIKGESFAAYEPRLIASLHKGGFSFMPDSSLDRLVANPPRYTGGIRQPTITRYAWRQHNIPAVQVELSAWVRIVERLPGATNARNGSAPYFRGDGARILRVYDALYEFIQDVLGDPPT